MLGTLKQSRSSVPEALHRKARVSDWRSMKTNGISGQKKPETKRPSGERTTLTLWPTCGPRRPPQEPRGVGWPLHRTTMLFRGAGRPLKRFTCNNIGSTRCSLRPNTTAVPLNCTQVGLAVRVLRRSPIIRLALLAEMALLRRASAFALAKVSSDTTSSHSCSPDTWLLPSSN